ncbi:hypothetical protein BKI52_43965 [marine bacterium AO1-C]|nr:hypothetical protein BKI52_43965 [marine bacterium AO1-C]
MKTMKLKLLFFSGILLLVLNSCQLGVKLPSEVVMSLDRSRVTYVMGGGSYINGIRGTSIMSDFQRRLPKKLRRNRIKVIDGGYTNTPYRLVVDTIKLTQNKIETTVRDERCVNPQKVWVEQVCLTFGLTLYKEGVKIDEWHIIEGCTENAKECNGFLNALFGDEDACPSFCARRLLNFRVNPMTKRVIKKLRVQVSRKIKETGF